MFDLAGRRGTFVLITHDPALASAASSGPRWPSPKLKPRLAGAG
jgi:hypothetical protein